MTANKRPADFDDSDSDFDENFGAEFDDMEDGDGQEDAEASLDASTASHRNIDYARRLRELDDDDAGDGTDDADPEADETTAHRPTWTVETLLQRLAETPDDIPLNEYFVLSDLTRLHAEAVRRAWPALDPVVRRRTLDALIQGAEEFLDVDLGVFLLAILEDPDAEIRHLALETLGDNEPSPEMLGPIIQRLLHDPDDDVRAAAAGALGYFVLAGELDELDAALAMRAEAVLITVLTEPAEPPAVQRRALESLAYSGEVGVRQFIEDAYYSPDEELRIGALVAMGRSADLRWRKLVRAELRNPSAPMRAEAAIACGELETKSALPDLLDLLEDADFMVRVAAIFALGRLGGKAAQRALAAIAASDADEAEAAELALEEMLFYAGEDATTFPLFEEGDEEDELDDLDPWDEWAEDDEDDDLGEYE
jgi:HEAT repeat protein